jgi:hypothetical protein
MIIFVANFFFIAMSSSILANLQLARNDFPLLRQMDEFTE